MCQRLFKELIMGIVFSKEDENYDKENGTPTVLLLGNGFDLQLGLKSRYEDFLLYLFFLKVLHQLSVDNIKEIKEVYLNILKEGEKEYFKTSESKDLKSNSQETEFSNPNRENDKKKFLSILEIAKKRFECCEKEKKGILEILENNLLFSCILSILSQNSYRDKNGRDLSLTFGESFPFNNIFAKDICLCDELVDIKNTNSKIYPDKIYNLDLNDVNNDVLFYIKEIKGELDDKNLSIINGWMDVESVIECLLTKNKHLLTRFTYYKNEEELNFIGSEKSIFEYCEKLNLKDDFKNAYEMKDSLKQFTHEFCKFIQIQVDHVKEQKDLIESLKIELNKEIDLYKSGQDATFIKKVDLFSNIHYVLDYNYSSLAELFQEYSMNTLHVNGKSEDETAIFGINEDTCFSQNGAQQYQEQQNKYCTYFFKQSQRVLKHVLGFNYENLNSLSHGYITQQFVKKTLRGFNLIIYGHSCSPADFDVIKTLLTHPNLRVAVVLCYNKEAMLSAYHNIRTMLGPQKIAEMMQVSSKMEKRLFFLERQES